MTNLPLRGVTVLDFFWQIAGPLGSKALLELGARVIRVESSLRPCNLRAISGGAFQDMNHGGVLHSVNSCKESLALNLADERGRELILNLIPRVDVVTNNYTPGAMKKWGFSFDKLRELNPRLVYVSLPAMGNSGPKKDWRAYGNQVSAIAGINAVTGFEGDPFFGPGIIYADFVGNPFHAATAVIAGLERVRRTGEGVSIDIGQYEATAALIGQEILEETLLGRPTARLGNRHRWQTPHGVFPTAGFDKWIAISVSTDAQWRSLAAILELPDEEDWATFVGRKRREDEVEVAISEATTKCGGYSLAAALQAEGVPASVVQSLDDVVERDHYLGSQFFQPFQKDGLEYRISGPAARIIGTTPPVGLLADIGADTGKILKEFLGLHEDEIADLAAHGVLQ